MTLIEEILRLPPREFPSHLVTVEPAPVYRRRWELLVILVLLCAAPRMIVAWRSGAICPDGAWYVGVADALARGDLDASLQMEHLNVYPILLSFGARLGFDPQTTGQTIGVTLGTLAVLPLFGLLRRQFDDSVATVACGIYAVHPKLVEWSTELVRDSTFWFLMTLTLYCAWRAVTSAKWRWYIATGAAWTLAVHTRFEGWFLVIPIVGWTLHREWKNSGEARRMKLGAAMALAICPLFLLVVNLTWLRSLDRWEFGDFDRVSYVVLWAESTLRKVTSVFVSPAAAAESETPPATAWSSGSAKIVGAKTPPKRLSTVALAWGYCDVIRRGMTTVFFVLALWGVARWRQTWLLPDHRMLFYPAACIYLGIWIHFWYAQATSSRYSLSIVILGSPFAALALLDAVQLAHRKVQSLRIQLSFPAAFAAAVAPVLVACVVGIVRAGDVSREREASIGRWIRTNYGVGTNVVANGRSQLVTYYSQGEVTNLTQTPSEFEVINELRATDPEVAVVWKRAIDARSLSPLFEQAAALGYEPLAAGELPSPCREKDVVILRRSNAGANVARARRAELH